MMSLRRPGDTVSPMSLVRRLDARTLDVLLAAALVAVAQGDAWLGWHDGDNGTAVQRHRVLSAILLSVSGGVVAWRRTRPLPALVVLVVVGSSVAVVAGEAPFLTGLVPVLFVVYGVAAYARREREQWIGLGLACAGALVVASAVASLWTVSNVTFNLAVIVALWLVGRLVHTRGRRVEVAERSRAVAVAEERARIARELHDIVAHSVSMMVIQAGAAEELVRTDTDAALASLATIRRTGRDALLELRRLLDLLREAGSPDGTEPQPGLADLDRLVGDLRRAGLDVCLVLDGAAASIPAGVGLAAYRVVQESLVNVLKHAPAARVVVTVRVLRDVVEVDVSDDGDASSPSRAPAPGGHGLVGMRERVQLYGGRFEAARVGGQGFRVAASIPLDAITA
jgi:signal transduction histidine kinase